jgi:hypothetical protein
VTLRRRRPAAARALDPDASTFREVDDRTRELAELGRVLVGRGGDAHEARRLACEAYGSVVALEAARWYVLGLLSRCRARR